MQNISFWMKNFNLELTWMQMIKSFNAGYVSFSFICVEMIWTVSEF